jgi:hypothetical protein
VDGVLGRVAARRGRVGVDLVLSVAARDPARGHEPGLVVARAAERRGVLLRLKRRVLDGGLVDHVVVGGAVDRRRLGGRRLVSVR